MPSPVVPLLSAAFPRDLLKDGRGPGASRSTHPARCRSAIAEGRQYRPQDVRREIHMPDPIGTYSDTLRPWARGSGSMGPPDDREGHEFCKSHYIRPPCRRSSTHLTYRERQQREGDRWCQELHCGLLYHTKNSVLDDPMSRIAESGQRFRTVSDMVPSGRLALLLTGHARRGSEGTVARAVALPALDGIVDRRTTSKGSE
ncbi:hypothetical protein F4780DRAFT_406722 [Xylariomycetidae sp. FL0641]|nr:hypothetical protein F4780DRAFT_406722 [Xylariomycetidae sp. FL0641]